MHTHVYVYIYVAYTRICIHICIYICIYLYRYIHMIYVYIHILYIHIYIHLKAQVCVVLRFYGLSKCDTTISPFQGELQEFFWCDTESFYKKKRFFIISPIFVFLAVVTHKKKSQRHTQGIVTPERGSTNSPCVVQMCRIAVCIHNTHRNTAFTRMISCRGRCSAHCKIASF